MSDKELTTWLDKLIAGDQTAFEVIYRLTKKKVYGTVAMLVTNKEDVDDIVSEIYCQLWKVIPDYDRTRPFLFWLNGIVLNQVSSWRRQIWRRLRLYKKSESLHEEIASDPPDELLIKSEGQVEMINLINKLPFKLRIVVLYRFYYDFTYEEISELLNIPVGTVKSRSHTALKQIRQRFGTHLEREVTYQNVYSTKNE